MAGPATPGSAVPEPLPVRRRRRRGWILFLSSSSWARWPAPEPGGTPRDGSRPCRPILEGAARADAEAALQRVGLEADFTPAYSETVAVGGVVRTDPGPGERILTGATVQVDLSKGPERYEVPDVTNITPEQAANLLDDQPLVLAGQVLDYSETVPAGLVIRTEPAAFESVKRDTEIRLVVSQGRESFPIPTVEGKTAEEAKQILEAAGFVVIEDPAVFHDTVPEGVVVAQSPKDTSGFGQSGVHIVVSQGPRADPGARRRREAAGCRRADPQRRRLRGRIHLPAVGRGLQHGRRAGRLPGQHAPERLDHHVADRLTVAGAAADPRDHEVGLGPPVDRQRGWAVAGLIGTALVWGATFSAVKHAVTAMPATDFLAIRFTLAAVVMLALRPGSLRRVHRRTLRHGIPLGILLALAYLAQTTGLERTTPAVSGVLTGVLVVLVPFVAAAILRTPLPRLVWGALATAAIGVAVLASRGAGLGTGEGLTLVAALVLAGHLVALAVSSEAHDLWALTVVQLLTAATVFAVLAAPGGIVAPPDLGVWGDVRARRGARDRCRVRRADLGAASAQPDAGRGAARHRAGVRGAGRGLVGRRGRQLAGGGGRRPHRHGDGRSRDRLAPLRRARTVLAPGPVQP